jgi:hypothetical protein
MKIIRVFCCFLKILSVIILLIEEELFEGTIMKTELGTKHCFYLLPTFLFEFEAEVDGE